MYVINFIKGRWCTINGSRISEEAKFPRVKMTYFLALNRNNNDKNY